MHLIKSIIKFQMLSFGFSYFCCNALMVVCGVDVDLRQIVLPSQKCWQNDRGQYCHMSTHCHGNCQVWSLIYYFLFYCFYFNILHFNQSYLHFICSLYCLDLKHLEIKDTGHLRCISSLSPQLFSLTQIKLSNVFIARRNKV